MIIFYKKITGNIVGTIDGRIHSEEHLKMWIGKKEETDRLIVQWKPIKDYKDEKGNLIAQDFAPNHKQADIFIELDKNPSEVYKYKVDLKTLNLIPK